METIAVVLPLPVQGTLGEVRRGGPQNRYRALITP